ncbi:MAG TPA: hypothetical protein VMS74_07310 [Acidimicrobiia bacterium]|nr:hypothetical protein [Acidimicrobiia bacterium]
MITLAHGLYIDDFLWFAVPVGLSLWGLRWAERKARARAEAEAPGDEDGAQN